jgi:hypothetical protein
MLARWAVLAGLAVTPLAAGPCDRRFRVEERIRQAREQIERRYEERRRAVERRMERARDRLLRDVERCLERHGVHVHWKI